MVGQSTQQQEAETRSIIDEIRGSRYTDPIPVFSDAFSEYQRAYRDNRGALEHRVMTTGTAATGGNLITEEFSNSLEVNMLAWGGMLANSTVLTTSTGEGLHLATIDDTAIVGTIVAESADAHK